LAFPLITDSEIRGNLRALALAYPRIIPSLRLFFENIKYLKPIIQVMKKAFLPPKFKGTIREAVRRRYVPPPDGMFPVQVSENGFVQEQRDHPDYGFWSAYRQLNLFAMRHFFGLSNSCPRGAHKYTGPHKQPDPHELWNRFAELSKTLGFGSPRFRPLGVSEKRPAEYVAIYSLLTSLRPSDLFEYEDSLLANLSNQTSRALMSLTRKPMKTASPTVVTGRPEDWAIENRCGMTDVDSFFSDQGYLFMNNIYRLPEELPGRHLTSFAVKRSIFLAFFGSGFNDSGSQDAIMEETVVTSAQSADIQPQSSLLPPLPASMSISGMPTSPPQAGSAIPTSQAGPLVLVSEAPLPMSASDPVVPVSQAGALVPVLQAGPAVPAYQGDLRVKEETVAYCKFAVHMSPGKFLAHFNNQVKKDYIYIFDVGRDELICLRYSHRHALPHFINGFQWICDYNKGTYKMHQVTNEGIIARMTSKEVYFVSSTRYGWNTDLLLPDATIQVNGHCISMPVYNETDQKWDLVPGEEDL
jgi:hypothetical protein